MSLFENKTIVLPDGAEVLLRSPRVEEATQLLVYLDAVRSETNGIMYSPADRLPSLEEERQWVRGHTGNDDAVHVAAEVGGEIVALAGVDPTRFTRQSHLAGVGISIREKWCSRGLGSILMRELIEWSRERPGLKMLTLCVFANNPRAQAVYRKVGFREDGRLPRRAKVNDDYVDIIEMSLWLEDGEAFL